MNFVPHCHQHPRPSELNTLHSSYEGVDLIQELERGAPGHSSVDLVVDGASVNTTDVNIVPERSYEIPVFHAGGEAGEGFWAPVRVSLVERDDAIICNLYIQRLRVNCNAVHYNSQFPSVVGIYAATHVL